MSDHKQPNDHTFEKSELSCNCVKIKILSNSLEKKRCKSNSSDNTVCLCFLLIILTGQETSVRPWKTPLAWDHFILCHWHLLISFENTMKPNRRDAMSIDALPWRKTAEVKGDVPVAQSVVRTRVWRTRIEWVVSITWQEAKTNRQVYEKRGEEILVQHS